MSEGQRADLDTLLSGAGGEAVSTPEQTPAAPVETPAAAEPASEGTQPRDDQGRFAPKADAKAEATPPVTAAIANAGTQVPPELLAQTAQAPRIDAEQFKGYLEERDKRKALEAELAEFKKQQQTQAQPTRQMPDQLTDPEGFQRWLDERDARRDTLRRVNDSEAEARSKFGGETVDQMATWAEQKIAEETRRFGFSPFQQQYANERSPVVWAIEQKKLQDHLSQVGNDPAKWDEWALKRAAELAATQSAQPSPPASPQSALSQPPPPRPTPSLASATSAGGISLVPTGRKPLEELLKG